KQLRDFCYIDDIVDAIMKAAILPEARGRVINVASGTPVSIRNTIEKVINLIGNGKPCFGGHPYRVGESMQLYADISLARQLLGWEPCMTMEEGLKKTIEYYKEQMENE
ncbi:MAG: NAD(P)-dependent oxidoreductase, partial [Candidatus Scalindua sp.]|nr:NAD(P)-dependent oxidoreductase [Candidatus Scalindua sp.]